MTFPSALPEPRTPDPRSAPPLRWGVLAPGRIAETFVATLRKHSVQRVVAVGSRDAARAAAFAARHGIERSYGGYEALVADPEVDVVYVASPHSEHRAQARLAIAAGKHVLVEKAFAVTAAEAREVFAAARAAGVIALEAMWTRFLPTADVVRRVLEGGLLGEVMTVTADFGRWVPLDAGSRLYDPRLAGGALLDLGVYPLAFASMVLGAPAKVIATGGTAATGVDDHATALLTTAGAAHAVVQTSFRVATPTTASVAGTAARLEIAGDFFVPQPVSLVGPDGARATWSDVRIHGHEGLVYPAAELARMVADGRRESELLPAAESVQILATVDEIRRQLGAALPADRAG